MLHGFHTWSLHTLMFYAEIMIKQKDSLREGHVVVKSWLDLAIIAIM